MLVPARDGDRAAQDVPSATRHAVSSAKVTVGEERAPAVQSLPTWVPVLPGRL